MLIWSMLTEVLDLQYTISVFIQRKATELSLWLYNHSACQTAGWWCAAVHDENELLRLPTALTQLKEKWKKNGRFWWKKSCFSVYDKDVQFRRSYLLTSAILYCPVPSGDSESMLSQFSACGIVLITVHQPPSYPDERVAVTNTAALSFSPALAEPER